MDVPKIDKVIGIVLLLAVLAVVFPLVMGYIVGTSGFVPLAITALNVTGVIAAVGGATNFNNLFGVLPYLAVAFGGLLAIFAVVTKAMKMW